MGCDETIVEYTKLRPSQLVKRREALPVAYLGLGTLEWHGYHNPLGLDGLKPHYLLCRIARKLGGVVMPPLFWGDDRNSLAELVFDQCNTEGKKCFPKNMGNHTLKIAEGMKLPKESFIKAAERSTESGGARLWIELVAHMLVEIESFGFKLIVIYPGHGGFWGPATAEAVDMYGDFGGTCEVFTLKETISAKYNKICGDIVGHADCVETSLMMALRPDLVDLNESKDKDKTSVGVVGGSPLEATTELGQEILDEMTGHVKTKIDERFGTNA